MYTVRGEEGEFMYNILRNPPQFRRLFLPPLREGETKQFIQGMRLKRPRGIPQIRALNQKVSYDLMFMK